MTISFFCAALIFMALIFQQPKKKYIMDVIIQSLGFKHSNNLEEYINEKLQKLTPGDQIVRANVTLFQGPDSAVESDYCEIRLEVPGPDLFIKEKSTGFEQSIDECINKLQGILRKQKEKMVDSHRRAGTH